MRLVGGDPSAHLDLIHWMRSCCKSNSILPLSSIIASLTRYILAVTAICLLRIRSLDQELPSLISRLQNQLLGVEAVGKLFSSGDSILPEIRDGISLCVARHFSRVTLPEVSRWLHLGKMNKSFDEGIGEWLRQAQHGRWYDRGDVTGAQQTWFNKSDPVHAHGPGPSPYVHSTPS